MKAKDTLAGLGGMLLLIVLLLLGIAVVSLFIRGASWASTKLLPWFFLLTWIGLIVVIFILLPLAIPKMTRGFSSIALLIASYIFGATLWMSGLLLTLMIWGAGAVFIGLFLAGVGVVPIAMLATLIKGQWALLIMLIALTVMTFGSRAGAFSLAASLDE